MKAVTIFSALLLAAGALTAAEAELRGHVEHLASPALAGRLTGTEGARQAGDYLAERLSELGALPLPGLDDFTEPFEFTAGTEDAGTTLTLIGPGGVRAFLGTESVRALAFSDNGQVKAPVVVAGYGLKVPKEDGYAYDSYATLDVEDKIVLVFRYFPEDVDQETRGRLARYSGLRYKALQARERGAKALLVVTGPRSPNAGETIAITSDTAVSGSGIVAASISGEVTAALLEAASGERTLEKIQRSFDDGNPHVTGFDLEGVEVSLEVKVEREKRTARNVVGYFPGTAVEGLEKPWVLLGAHYDHLGSGNAGNSLARKEEAGAIHHGADDNASGVAAVLAAAEQLASKPLRRHLAVAFWSGEELGVLGSADFVNTEVVGPEEIGAYVNLDMVGRMRDNKLTLQATGSSSVWPSLVERANVPVGFDLQMTEDPYLPTDSTSFNGASVPTLNFFTGSHEDYHRPSDTAEKINYDDLERVARFGALLVARLADLEEAPDFVKVQPRAPEGGGRDSVRAFTGTIPDYTTEVEGLRLSGVIEGGPADKAGIMEGDVIVAFAGQTITNIYDYTYALDAVRIGEPTIVVLLRDGERVEVTIIPRARD